jgi:hypothetical protein
MGFVNNNAIILAPYVVEFVLDFTFSQEVRVAEYLEPQTTVENIRQVLPESGKPDWFYGSPGNE